MAGVQFQRYKHSIEQLVRSDFILTIDTLSRRFNGHFTGGRGLTGTRVSSILDFIGATGDGGGEW